MCVSFLWCHCPLERFFDSDEWTEANKHLIKKLYNMCRCRCHHTAVSINVFTNGDPIYEDVCVLNIMGFINKLQ